MSGIIGDFKSEAKKILLDALKSVEDYRSKPEFRVLFNELSSCFYGLQGAAKLLKFENLKRKSQSIFESLVEFERKDDFSDQDLANIENEIAQCIQLLDKDQPNDQRVSEEDLKHLQDESIDQPIVYIVEDEKFMQELLESIVGSQDYKVEIFDDGERAIDKFKKVGRENRPDCILTDLTMPFKSGLQLIQEIQDIDPFIPVIFISGDVTKDTVIQAISYGVFGVIEKPFRPEHVISVLNNAIKRSHLNRLLDKSISLLSYQLENFAESLKQLGKESEVQVVKNELKSIIEKRKRLFKVEQGKKIKLL